MRQDASSCVNLHQHASTCIHIHLHQFTCVYMLWKLSSSQDLIVGLVVFQSESDLQSEVRSQTEADRQPAPAVDDTHHTHYGNFPQYLVNRERINACWKGMINQKCHKKELYFLYFTNFFWKLFKQTLQIGAFSYFAKLFGHFTMMTFVVLTKRQVDKNKQNFFWPRQELRKSLCVCVCLSVCDNVEFFTESLSNFSAGLRAVSEQY